MLKRILCALLALALLASLTACKKSTGGSSSDEWEYEYETVTNKKNKDSSGEDNTSTGASQSGAATKNSSGGTSSSGKGGNIVVKGAGTDPLADYKASGTVIVSVDTARANDYQGLFDAFKQVFPKVKLKIDYFAHSSEDSAAEYLSARAAAVNMPDIVYDDTGRIPTYLTQGWMYPLDEFVKGDTDYRKYVPDNLKADYTYGGKLYALPHQAHYETFLLNLDLLTIIQITAKKR